MNKSEFVDWMREEYQQWEALLDQIGLERMDQLGVTAHWSMKDVVAHLSGWNRWVLARLQVVQRGDREPSPPWPAQLRSDDEINAWIYESNRGRSVHEILDETHQIFEELLTVVEALPDDVRIENVHQTGRVYHLVWLDDERFQPGEFFDHFHDDHEPDIRAWLARE